jgi:hypothetical protein
MVGWICDKSARIRRSDYRAFQPTIDGRLEARVLLTRNAVHQGAVNQFLLKHTTPRAAYNLKSPRFLAHDAPHFFNAHRRTPHYIGTQTAHGGQAVEVTALDGSHYMVKLSYTSNTLATNNAEGLNGQGGNSSAVTLDAQISMQNANFPQPIGTIRAYAMPHGRVGIIVDGTTDNVDLTINPLGQSQRKGFAHSFAYGESNRTHILNIGKLVVNSGEIGSIQGFHVADLSGPLIANGTTAIDRIAFNAILPGASITTGGDLNTLDVLNGIDLSGAGTGIHVGRDLNLLNVGTTLDLTNGATFSVGRDLGLVNQPPKGTGTGTNVLTLNFNTLQNTTVSVTTVPPSVSTFIQGNVIISPGSTLTVGRNIVNFGYIEGSITGFSRWFVNAATAPTNPTFISAIPSSQSPFFRDNVVIVLGGGTP